MKEETDGRASREELIERIEHLEKLRLRMREKIRHGREYFDAVFNSSPDSIFLLDRTGAILAVNRHGALRMNSSARELVGRNIFDMLPAPLVQRRRHWFAQALESPLPMQFKDEYKGIIYGHRLTTTIDSRTNAAIVTAITRDITDSERAIEEMRTSQMRYRAIVQDQNELICRFLPDGTLSFVNEAYARFFDRRPEQMVGKPFAFDIPEPDRQTVDAAVARLSPVDPVVSFEHRVVLDNGETHWLRWSHRAIYDMHGELVEVQAVGHAITARKEAEDKLIEHREFLHQIIDTVPNLIFVKDREGRFTLVNRAMADMYGARPEELIGRQGRDFNPHEDETTMFRVEDMEVLDSGQPIFIPQRAITNSRGEMRWYATVKLPLTGKEQLLGVAVDITERKEAEAERLRIETQMRQSQKMQALGTLAGGIAHDFNNMLFAILGFVRLSLKQAQPDTKLHTYLEQIQSAALRASDLVRQILTFSRQTDQVRRPLALTPLCKEVVKLISATMPSNVEVNLYTWAKRDVVLGDATQLHQIMMNLCTNAGHAMRESGGTLTVSLDDFTVQPGSGSQFSDLPVGDYISVKVQDTGHGIDPDIIDQIFDPFFTTKKPGEGTGMGLSVVHGIVRSHGGLITVSSNPGTGAEFLVVLPLIRERGEDDPRIADDAPRGTERILFVDDETLLIQMAGELLTELGYTVTSFDDPEVALHAFRARPEEFDLLITDQTMPRMTGVELARQILTVRADLPVLVTTGFVDQLTEETLRELGNARLLVKPVAEDRFARAIRRILDTTAEEGRTTEEEPCADSDKEVQ